MAILKVFYRYKKGDIINKKLRHDFLNMDIDSCMLLISPLEKELEERYGYDKVNIERILISRSKTEGRIM